MFFKIVLKIVPCLPFEFVALSNSFVAHWNEMAHPTHSYWIVRGSRGSVLLTIWDGQRDSEWVTFLDLKAPCHWFHGRAVLCSQLSAVLWWLLLLALGVQPPNSAKRVLFISTTGKSSMVKDGWHSLAYALLGWFVMPRETERMLCLDHEDTAVSEIWLLRLDGEWPETVQSPCT